MPSKVTQIATWLYSNGGYVLTPATPAQIALFNKHINGGFAYPVPTTQLLQGCSLQGIYAGYYVVFNPAYTNPAMLAQGYVPFLALRLYKSGGSSHTVNSLTLTGVQQAICHNIAWGAAQRRANIGAWQYNLPPHLQPPITPRTANP